MSHKNKTLSASVAAAIFKEDIVNQETTVPEVTEESTVPPVEEPLEVIPEEVKPEPDPTERVIPAPKKPAVDRSAMRIRDIIDTNLEKYADEKSSPNERIQALAKVVDGITKQPKKDILDNVLKFFYQHRGDKLFTEANALQGIAALEMTLHYKVRIFYTVMMSLANNTATQKNTSIEVIRNLFRSDDFPNWVAVQLAKRAR